MSMLKAFVTMNPVIDAFEQIGIHYYIAGSVASSAYGIPRMTADIDVIADLREDTILSKLEWYRMGGETSDRQWNDLPGMLKLQGTALDFACLQRWASALQVEDLLKRAYDDAGLEVE